MQENKEEITKNYYNAIARGYANLYHEEQIKKINLIKDYLPRFGRVLDLGSGDGVLNNFFKDCFIKSNFELISCDLSLELLKLNSNRENNKFCSSIYDLPFKKKEFDYILSFTVFQDLSDVSRAMVQVKKVLKKEGIFILSFLCICKNLNLLLNEIKTNFNILKEIKEEKDYIFVLKNK